MKNKMLITLIVSALIFLIAPFLNNHYIFAFGVTQFVIVVIGCVYSTLRGINMSQVIKHNDDMYCNAIKNKKPIQVFAYGSAVPAIVLGTVVLLALTISVWFK